MRTLIPILAIFKNPYLYFSKAFYKKKKNEDLIFFYVE